MHYLKKKTFWYTIVASLVFFTDIWIYLYLKDPTRTSKNELIQKTDSTFLLDRLLRAKNSLEGIADSSEVQDNRELEKIIEN